MSSLRIGHHARAAGETGIGGARPAGGDDGDFALALGAAAGLPIKANAAAPLGAGSDDPAGDAGTGRSGKRIEDDGKGDLATTALAVDSALGTLVAASTASPAAGSGTSSDGAAGGIAGPKSALRTSALTAGDDRRGATIDNTPGAGAADTAGNISLSAGTKLTGDAPVSPAPRSPAPLRVGGSDDRSSAANPVNGRSDAGQSNTLSPSRSENDGPAIATMPVAADGAAPDGQPSTASSVDPVSTTITAAAFLPGLDAASAGMRIAAAAQSDSDPPAEVPGAASATAVDPDNAADASPRPMQLPRNAGAAVALPNIANMQVGAVAAAATGGAGSGGFADTRADTRGRFATASGNGAPDATAGTAILGGDVALPVGSAGPATAGALPTPAAVIGSDQLGEQIAGQLVRMVSIGPQEMVMRLHPPELGDLTLRVAVSGRDVTAWFASPQPQVQTAITGALGQLQTDLGNAGYNLSGAWVGADAAGARQQRENPPPAPLSATAGTAPAPATTSSVIGSRPKASGMSIYV